MEKISNSKVVSSGRNIIYPAVRVLFLVSLWVNGDRVSEGEGKNKKDAEQAAAARALSDLREKEVSV